MNMKEFLKRNRASIPGSNDEEREMWVLNDESLYLWAKSEGVRI